MSWRIQKLQDKERRRRLDAIRSKHARIKDSITDAEAEKEMEADLRRKYPEREFPKVDDALFAATVTSQDPTDKLRLGDAAAFLLRFTFLNPEASIAIAPFGQFPELADPSTSRDGPEIFGVAVERLNSRAKLGNWPEVRFQWLPSYSIVSVRGNARWLRFSLGADALIWGHYHVKDDEDTIWARFEIADSGRPKEEWQNKRDEDQSYRSAFFRRDVDIAAQPLTLRADDHFGALIALCACLLRVLQHRKERWDRGWRKRASNWKIGYALLRLGDKLAVERSSYASHIARFLIAELVTCRKSSSAECGILASADLQLVEIISSWVGALFADYSLGLSSGVSDDVDIEAKPFLNEIRRILEFCIELAPQQAEHYYRLGLILCLLGEVDEAVLRLRRAGELDVRKLRADTIMPSVLAEMALGKVDLKYGTQLRMARGFWALHMAAVIAIGGEKGREKAKGEMPKARGELTTDEPMDPAELIVQRLLESKV
jgi:hypothetical protein